MYWLHFSVVAAPTKLMGVQENLTSVRVSWIPHTQLGDTTGYRIYYSDGDNSDSVDVRDGSTDKYLLTGLVMGATYTISIVATTQNFCSERVEIMISLCKVKNINENAYFILPDDSVTGVHLSLAGYDSIPTDGSGRVRINDINPNGVNDEDALICHSGKPISGDGVGDWFLHPTEMSTEDDDRIANPPVDRGWLRNRGSISGHQLVRLRRRAATAEEGVFTCDIPGDFGTPVSVGIYYAGE